MKHSQYFFICGLGGTGKDTIMEEIKKNKDFMNKFTTIPQITTRPKRDNEVNGENKIFYELSDFTTDLVTQDIVGVETYTMADGNKVFYGYSRRALLEPGHNFLFSGISVEGAYGIINDLDIEKDSHIVHLWTNPNIRLIRQIKRLGDNPTDDSLKEACRRVMADIDKSALDDEAINQLHSVLHIDNNGGPEYIPDIAETIIDWWTPRTGYFSDIN